MNESIENNVPEGKILKTSITKAELAELPAAPYRGKVTVIDSPEQVEGAVSSLSKYEILGFDTETKPSFRKGEKHFVSLLQLSNGEECFLFRLNMIGMPDSVRKLLEDKNPIKIGLSIHDDFMNLKRKFTIEPDGFVELQNYVKQYGIADNSLSRIYAILFDRRISKGQRLSNWEAPILTLHQKEYAALDALACLDIFNHLETHGFDYRQSKYYRLFDDPNYLQLSKKNEAAAAKSVTDDKPASSQPQTEEVQTGNVQTGELTSDDTAVGHQEIKTQPKKKKRSNAKRQPKK